MSKVVGYTNLYFGMMSKMIEKSSFSASYVAFYCNL